LNPIKFSIYDRAARRMENKRGIWLKLCPTRSMIGSNIDKQGSIFASRQTSYNPTHSKSLPAPNLDLGPSRGSSTAVQRDSSLTWRGIRQFQKKPHSGQSCASASGPRAKTRVFLLSFFLILHPRCLLVIVGAHGALYSFCRLSLLAVLCMPTNNISVSFKGGFVPIHF